MSYLYRTGNSRNNIAYTNTANSSTRYLRRLGSGRTNINWYTIPQGSTYNILQRNGTGRNNILWSNLKIASPSDPTTQSNISTQTYVTQRSWSVIFFVTNAIGIAAIYSDSNGNSPANRSKAILNNIYFCSYGSSFPDEMIRSGSRWDDNFESFISQANKITIYSNNNIWVTAKVAWGNISNSTSSSTMSVADWSFSNITYSSGYNKNNIQDSLTKPSRLIFSHENW